MIKNKTYGTILLVAFLAAGLLWSCQQDLPSNIKEVGALALTASKTSVILDQKGMNKEAFALTWTTGTNGGTGASISYLIQIDKKGNNFSKPMNLDMGKGIYTKSIIAGQLNDSLLTRWNCTVGAVVELEVRVIDTIFSSPKAIGYSPVINVSAIPYQPVSSTLYLY